VFAVCLAETVAIIGFRKRNGAVIWRDPNHRAAQFVAPAVVPGITLAVIFAADGFDLFPLIITIVVVGIPAFAFGLKSFYHGIYDNRVIGKEFVCEWRDVERVIVMDDCLRIVDRNRGAIEFRVGGAEAVAVARRIRGRADVEVESTVKNPDNSVGALERM
jgi:hypothetical protein